MLAALLRLIHRGTAPVPSLPDDDGACAVCDHPFGSSHHMCVGADIRIAS